MNKTVTISMWVSFKELNTFQFKNEKKDNCGFLFTHQKNNNQALFFTLAITVIQQNNVGSIINK